MKTICRVLTALLAVRVALPPWRSARRVYIQAGVVWADSVVISCDRILSVIRIERVHRIHDLGEIVFCLCLSGLVLNCFERGEEQADQDRDDRDDD